MAMEKISQWLEHAFLPDRVVQRRFALFQNLLRQDRRSLKLLSLLEETARSEAPPDWSRIVWFVERLGGATRDMIRCLQQMRPGRYEALGESHGRLTGAVDHLLHARQHHGADAPYCLALRAIPRSSDHLVGGKADALARVVRETALAVPDGFVITTSAFQALLQHNGLREPIARELLRLDLRHPARLHNAADRLQRLILQAEVPAAVASGIDRAMAAVEDAARTTWAVRSSAVAEDGEISFAGQYLSVLDVDAAELQTAYKKVVAGKYSATALTYRLHNGIADDDAPMAALVLPMIDSRRSGVMYTLDPLDACGGECLLLSAVPGVGGGVGGGRAADQKKKKKTKKPRQVWARRPAPAGAGAGRQICLTDEEAAMLAAWGLELEALMGVPQDVEWTQDHAGRLFILQSRPVRWNGRILPRRAELAEEDPPVVETAALLEMGMPASPGIACGPVYRLGEGGEAHAVPRGSVVVTHGLPPSLVPLVERAGAVLAESGSRTSHFALVAREFALPVIVGLGDCEHSLLPGRTVTVDGHRGIVYAGEVAELLSWKAPARPVSPFRRKMADLLRILSPLNLTDPAAPDFLPQNCRSLHDIIRYVHEQGTQEMFSLVDGKRGLRHGRPLKSALPLVMRVFDLGEGLSPADDDADEAVTPDCFVSIPMRAIWAGLNDGDIRWHEGLLHLDWQRFDRISGGIFAVESSSQLASYALVARHYAHLLLRFGYHFAVVDTLCGDYAEENYIQFRFKGGGGTAEKKRWRVKMLERVLRRFGFSVSLRQDMFEARYARRESEALELRLRVIGYLLGRTPLLDMALGSEAEALELAERIIGKWRPGQTT